MLFALFAWSRALLRLRDKDIGIGEFIFWSVIWAVVIVLSLFPTVLTGTSAWLGIAQGIDAVIYVSIVILFYLVFRIYVQVDTMNKEITTLVRQIAMKNVKKKK
jgi:hypothetical protein